MAEVIKQRGSRAARGKLPQSAASQPGHGDADDGFFGRVLEMMSHHERMALRLRHRDGLEPAAIAARMNLPETIVADLLRRAEATIRAAQLAFLEALSEHAPRAAPR
jgi:DNA-directed RNA polymerase specialized sigma24 family protein